MTKGGDERRRRKEETKGGDERRRRKEKMEEEEEEGEAGEGKHAIQQHHTMHEVKSPPPYAGANQARKLSVVEPVSSVRSVWKICSLAVPPSPRPVHSYRQGSIWASVI